MYKVIANEKGLIDWLGGQKHKQVKRAFISSGAILLLKKQLQIMDICYGAERDIEKDLGGYMIILFGEEDEVQKKYQQVLHYHHLQENEFEYQEIYNSINSHEKIQIRLYLCSSDYSVILAKVLG